MTRKEARRNSAKSKTSPETGAPAWNKGSAGAFPLSQKTGQLRYDARAYLLLGINLLSGHYLGGCEDALWAIEERLPDVALRRIARAEAEIRRAKKALMTWSKIR